MQKLIPLKVTIQPCNIGLGYFYKGKCFAYVWAMKTGSPAWWGNLLFMADVNSQIALLFASDLAIRNRKRRKINESAWWQMSDQERERALSNL